MLGVGGRRLGMLGIGEDVWDWEGESRRGRLGSVRPVSWSLARLRRGRSPSLHRSPRRSHLRL